MSSASIFGIILSKFRHKKKPYSIILFKVVKGSKVDFYYIILPFCLTSHLRVEGSQKFLLDA